MDPKTHQTSPKNRKELKNYAPDDVQHLIQLVLSKCIPIFVNTKIVSCNMGIQEIGYSLNMFRIKEIVYSLELV
jgi:hypothetical protein